MTISLDLARCIGIGVACNAARMSIHILAGGSSCGNGSQEKSWRMPISKLAVILYLPEKTRVEYVQRLVRWFEKAKGVRPVGVGMSLDIDHADIIEADTGAAPTKED